jgi:hypothetical protein
MAWRDNLTCDTVAEAVEELADTFTAVDLVGPAGGLVGSSQRSDGGRPATAAQGARRRPSSSTEGSGSSSISCSRDVALHHRLGTNTYSQYNCICGREQSFYIFK